MSSLWPEINLDQPIRTPKSILIEQGKEIEQMTNGLLSAQPYNMRADGNTFGIDYCLYAHTLNYRYSILELRYDIDLYPVHMTSEEVTGYFNEQDFVPALGSVLGSARVAKVIQALISQSLEEDD